MTLNETIMTPVWLVTFTREDVLQLDRCSKRHYDGTCQRMSAPGGLIYGLVNATEDRDSCETSLVFGEVDILCKVLESNNLYGYSNELFLSLCALLRSTRG